MPPRRSLAPKYCLHKPSGMARVRFGGRPENGGREIFLGKYNTPESLAEYRRICAELASGAAVGDPATVADKSRATTVSVVVLAFLKYADGHYRAPNGTLTSEHREHVRAVHHLLPLYAHTPTADFGPIALQTVRATMVKAGWCRSVVNKRIGRVRRIFRWAVSREMVPIAVVDSLACVQGLQKGRTAAPETEPVKPAPAADVAKVLPLLDRHQRAMAELQLLTGMRPGEACSLRLCEVERTGDVWVWRPAGHKTAWRGKGKVIVFGPRAQAVVNAFLAGGVEPVKDTDWLFSPRAAREERFKTARAARKSKVTPSQSARVRLASPKREPAAQFNVNSYGHAVAKACGKAGVPAFAPNQLRHSFATEARKRYGLEAVQVLLGHANMKTTEIYAEKNLELALKVAGEMG